MNEEVSRAEWDARHRGREAGGEPEPFVLEVLPLLPRCGLALDVAAGRGRHSFALARLGLSVVAADYSIEAMLGVGRVARAQSAPIWPVVADLGSFVLRDNTFDLIINVNFLARELFPRFIRALKRGGMLLADTFSIDQAAKGHPRNPRFLLGRYELRELLDGLELIRYREGLVFYSDTTSAWRAAALARKEG